MKLKNTISYITGIFSLISAYYLKVIPIKLLDGNLKIYSTNWFSLKDLLVWTETWKVLGIASIIFVIGFGMGKLIELGLKEVKRQ